MAQQKLKREQKEALANSRRVLLEAGADEVGDWKITGGGHLSLPFTVAGRRGRLILAATPSDYRVRLNEERSARRAVRDVAERSQA